MVDIPEKKCTVCKKIKFVYEFYRSNKTADGFLNYCTRCYKDKKKENPSELDILRKNSPACEFKYY